MDNLIPNQTDALLIVDVQNDFLRGGALKVPHGDEIIGALNHCIEVFLARKLPIYASRDWHPVNHCSFQSKGGRWPSHCVAHTTGAAFAANLLLPSDTIVISKADAQEKDAYSAFEGTSLELLLKEASIKRLFVGGLATDYCVLNTVRDAIALGYGVILLTDAVRAVDANVGDGERALDEMRKLGAHFALSTELIA